MARNVGVEFSFFGEKQINARFILLNERASDASPAFRQVVTFMRKVERRQWSTRGSFGGNRWEKLKTTTVRRKKSSGSSTVRGNANRILRESDDMWKSVTRQTPLSEIVVKRDEMLFSTKVPYAKIHQTGAPRNNMPARRVFDLNEMSRQEILRIIGGFISTGNVQKGVFR